MGVENNEYQIPKLVLGDTFNEWLNVSNESIIEKLNNISTYSATGGDGIEVTTSSAGLSQISLASVVPNGVTFSGNVVFNGSVTTINSTELTIDDFNIVLGASGSGKTDGYIGASGGGGILLMRSEGPTAEFIWKGITSGTTSGLGVLGVGSSGCWTTSEYINMTGGVGLKSNDDILRFKSGANATGSGLMITTVATADAPHGGTAINYDQKSMKIGHMSTASAAITQGVRFDQDGMVRIYDGVNKKYFSSGLTAHGFTFGQAVRLGAGGTCQLAHANAIEDAEVLGIVSEIINTKEFVVTMHGEVRGDFSAALGNTDGATLAPGSVYFLSGTAGNSGEITNQEPQAAGKIRKPMLLGFGATSGYVFQYVGAKIAPETDTIAPTMRRINIASGGSKDNGSTDLTCHKVSTGKYGITHGFNTTSYSLTVTPVGGGTVMYGNIHTKGSNYVTLEVYNGGNALVDNAVEVILAKDVT